MSLHIKRAKTIIASIIIVITVVLSILVYDWEKPEVSVVNGSSSVIYNGDIGSTFKNDTLNQTWANATISHQTQSDSVFYLHVGPGKLDREWSVIYGDWICSEFIPVTFGGIIDGDLHPSTVTFSIGTNGTNGNPSVSMQSTYSQSHNVSFSDKNAVKLSFLGNQTGASNFVLLNAPFSLVTSSNNFYKFNFTTVFIVSSTFETSFDRCVNLIVTLNGLSHTVADRISIEVLYGGS